MGRPKLTNGTYSNPNAKYCLKRPKLTPQQFHEQSQCEQCGGNHMLAEKPFQGKYSYYRTYGYRTQRVMWKIRCANRKCGTPFAVILKEDCVDSAGE